MRSFSVSRSQLTFPSGSRRPHSARGRSSAVKGPLPWYTRSILGTAAVVGLLVLWQVGAETKVMNPTFSSSPSGVVSSATALAKSGTLWSDFESSAYLFLVGFAISLVLGLLAGIILGWYRYLDALFDPIVSFLYAAPRIALIPLVIIWTGIGFETQVIVVVTNGVFPILINTIAGVRSVDRQLVTVARSFGGSNADMLRTVALPGAIPSIVAGIRQGLIMCIIGVVIAEYFVGSNGLGGLIVTAGENFDAGQAFVGVVIFALAAMVLTACLRSVEQRLDRWRA